MSTPVEAWYWRSGVALGDMDVDGDGDPDLYVCNDFDHADRLWLNDGTGRFRAADWQALRTTSYASMAVDSSDVDRDGWEDLLIAYGHGRDMQDADALEEIVRVTIPTEQGTRTVHRTVGSGGSFGASTLRVEIGLGQTSGPVSLEIVWPGGDTERVGELEIDWVYRVVEGLGKADLWALRPIDFTAN